MLCDRWNLGTAGSRGVASARLLRQILLDEAFDEIRSHLAGAEQPDDHLLVRLPRRAGVGDDDHGGRSGDKADEEARDQSAPLEQLAAGPTLVHRLVIHLLRARQDADTLTDLPTIPPKE